MAKRKIQKEEPKRPPNLVIPKKDAEQKIKTQIKKGCEIRDAEIHSDKELEEAERMRSKWSSYNVELLTRIFDNDSFASEYRKSWGGGVMSFFPTPVHEKIKDFRKSVTGKISKLESIIERLELIPEIDTALPKPEEAKKHLPIGRDIFIVHGRDEGAKEMVARFIGKLDLRPIILHEQPNAGRTIIEKFEAYSNVSFTIVLLTPDDIGAPKDAQRNTKYRARQNVILELGYFLGRLGRKRVCALYKKDVEIPSDYKGVLYIPLDERGGWKLDLAKEIKQAGIDVDLNEAM